MARSVEHIVEVHRLAQKRRAAGLPIWDKTIDLSMYWHNEELSFEERRDAIVAKIRKSGWLSGDDPYLSQLVDELGYTTDGNEFDEFMSEIYDRADFDRVWIRTF